MILWEKINEYYILIISFIKKYLLAILIISSLVVLSITGILIYSFIDRSRENSLLKDFDFAYYSYLYSSRESEQNQQELLRNFVETLERISKENEKYPVVANANIILGDLYFEQDNLDLALSYYQKAVKSRSEFFTTSGIFRISQVYERKGDIESAISNYFVIYNRYSKSEYAPISLFNIARIYYLKGDLTLSKTYLIELTNKYTNSGVTELAKKTLLLIEYKLSGK